MSPAPQLCGLPFAPRRRTARLRRCSWCTRAPWHVRDVSPRYRIGQTNSPESSGHQVRRKIVAAKHPRPRSGSISFAAAAGDGGARGETELPTRTAKGGASDVASTERLLRASTSGLRRKPLPQCSATDSCSRTACVGAYVGASTRNSTVIDDFIMLWRRKGNRGRKVAGAEDRRTSYTNGASECRMRVASYAEG